MRPACSGSALLPIALLVSCGDFAEYQVYDSGAGIYATVGVPVSQDAQTACLAARPLSSCPRSRAIYYGYRSRSGEIRWVGTNTLLIRQVGGEVRTRPPIEPVTVENQNITIRFEYHS